MADRFIIKGGSPLRGIVEISGYKNSAGACLAATLLTDKDMILDNLPLVEDIFSMIEILKSMGAKVDFLEEKRVRINTKNIDPDKMDSEMIPKTRVSVLLIGGLLPRFKKFKIPHPGGDRIGLRPISTHLYALKELGVEIQNENQFYIFNSQGLKGCEIVLKEFSPTATENLMLASVLAPGVTIIKGAAAEPQVQDLGKLLQKMGAKIKGIGTHTLFIEGVRELKGAAYSICPDPSEAGTFIAAGAVTQGEIEIRNIIPSHLDIFLDKLKEIGVDFQKGKNFVKVKGLNPSSRATKIQALPFPGFPTDLLPITVPILTQTEGKSLIHDPLYENSFNYIQELRKMGADVEMVDPHRTFVYGKTSLKGVRIESWDIRAGASLIIAALLAKGETVIDEVYQIDRGYEKIDEKLKKLGADIKRIST
jgi:UDP-N-acetylglucosamine 1-carboxyvinyltransferase